jgi:hypothetical protein
MEKRRDGDGGRGREGLDDVEGAGEAEAIDRDVDLTPDCRSATSGFTQNGGRSCRCGTPRASGHRQRSGNPSGAVDQAAHAPTDTRETFGKLSHLGLHRRPPKMQELSMPEEGLEPPTRGL